MTLVYDEAMFSSYFEPNLLEWLAHRETLAGVVECGRTAFALFIGCSSSDLHWLSNESLQVLTGKPCKKRQSLTTRFC